MSVEPQAVARGTILAAATLTIMAPAIIAPSLPMMEQVFAAPLLVRLALTVTSLAVAVTAPLAGLAVDRLGRRPLLVGCLALYAISGTSGYFLTDLGLLLVSRAVLGIAVGGVMTAVNATITDWFDGPRRASFLGLQQVFASASGVVFLPLAGVLAGFGWRIPFWLYGVAALVALFAYFSVHDVPRTVHASGAAPALGHGVFGIYLLAVVATLIFYMAPTQVPFLLARQGIGPAFVGVVVALSTLSSMLGGFAFPALRKRLRTDVITVLCIALLGAGWLLVGVTGTTAGTAAGLFVGGLGVGFAIPNLTLHLSELAPPAWRGRVFSGLVAGIFLGQFVSPLVVQPLIALLGVGAAFTCSGALLITGALVASGFLKSRSERTVR
ncbi:MFS transporter [Lentzea sp. NPDC058436]|uniref:MFS transporter n=1 Tax=Lentzea sp. NPDC058436 TaxID=3346499 RepID=UPI00364D8F40